MWMPWKLSIQHNYSSWKLKMGVPKTNGAIYFVTGTHCMFYICKSSFYIAIIVCMLNMSYPKGEIFWRQISWFNQAEEDRMAYASKQFCPNIQSFPSGAKVSPKFTYTIVLDLCSSPFCQLHQNYVHCWSNTFSHSKQHGDLPSSQLTQRLKIMSFWRDLVFQPQLMGLCELGG